MWEELIEYSKNLNGGRRPMPVSWKRDICNQNLNWRVMVQH